ncbi:putative complex I intermediate-associated protein 30 [Helianthus anomalus]
MIVFPCIIIAAFTWNIDDLIPPSERYIYNFSSKEELKKWHLYSDSQYEGSPLPLYP